VKLEPSRHEIPNDSVEILEPWRVWAATSRLAKPRSGWRTSWVAKRRRWVAHLPLPSQPQSVPWFAR
jgi:hypothetical protein